jgi:hypothetical protein
LASISVTERTTPDARRINDGGSSEPKWRAYGYIRPSCRPDVTYFNQKCPELTAIGTADHARRFSLEYSDFSFGKASRLCSVAIIVSSVSANLLCAWVLVVE